MASEAIGNKFTAIITCDICVGFLSIPPASTHIIYDISMQ